MAASKTLTKQQRVERARKAGKASTTLEAYVNRIVRRAGELSPEDLEKLRAVLPPVDREAAET